MILSVVLSASNGRSKCQIGPTLSVVGPFHTKLINVQAGVICQTYIYLNKLAFLCGVCWIY